MKNFPLSSAALLLHTPDNVELCILSKAEIRGWLLVDSDINPELPFLAKSSSTTISENAGKKVWGFTFTPKEVKEIKAFTQDGPAAISLVMMKDNIFSNTKSVLVDSEQLEEMLGVYGCLNSAVIRVTDTPGNYYQVKGPGSKAVFRIPRNRKLDSMPQENLAA